MSRPTVKRLRRVAFCEGEAAVQRWPDLVTSFDDRSERLQAIGMEKLHDKPEKVAALRRHFTPLIGKEISDFETAQIKIDGEWGHWLALPIRLYFGNDSVVSIAWSHFDTLFISRDKTLNFPTDGSEVRWVWNGFDAVKPALSGVLKSVKLGLGEMTIGDQKTDIWTRLLLEQDNGCLEIFNGLDENAFHFYRSKPAGEFVNCC